MVDANEAVLISNLLVTVGLFAATIYRILIEKKQLKWINRRMKDEEMVKTIKKILKVMEVDKCDDMTAQDFKKLLEKLVEEFEN